MAPPAFQIIPHKPIYQYGKNNRYTSKVEQGNDLKHSLPLDTRRSSKKRKNTKKKNVFKMNEKELPYKKICNRSLFFEKREGKETSLYNGNESCDAYKTHEDMTITKYESKVKICLDENKDIFEFSPNQSDSNNIMMVVEDNGNELRCPSCCITYMNKLSLKNHIQVCKVKNWSTSSISLHKSRVHSPSNEVYDQQKKAYEGIHKLSEDEKKSLKILEESCFNNMDKISYESMDLKEELVNENSFSMMYKCEECDEEYGNTIKFARHCYAHTFMKTDEQRMPCICSGCGRQFKTRKLLEDHIDEKVDMIMKCEKSFKCSGNVSEARVVFPCNLCGKVFTRKDNLRSHLRSYASEKGQSTNKQAKKYDCKVCGQSFGGTSLLSLHALTHKQIGNDQSSTKIYRCGKCGKVFSFSSTLKQHKLSCDPIKNTEVKIMHKCPKCPSVFDSKLQLIGHSRVHSSLKKPHQCHYCDNRFSNPAQLRLHLVSHENDEKTRNLDTTTFSCTKCDIIFGNRYNLERHLWHAHNERSPQKINEKSEDNDKVSPPNCKNDSSQNRVCKIEIKLEPSDFYDQTDDLNYNKDQLAVLENRSAIKEENIEEIIY